MGTFWYEAFGALNRWVVGSLGRAGLGLFGMGTFWYEDFFLYAAFGALSR